MHPVLLNGTALAEPGPSSSLMGKIDLLVRHEQLGPAQRTLEALGYEPCSEPDCPLTGQDIAGGELQMRGTRAGGGLVVLHWRVYPGDWARLASSLNEEAAWQRLRPLSVGGLEVRQLHPTDALVRLCLQAAVNGWFAANGLRPLVDVHRLVQVENVDWADLVEAARAQRVCTVGTRR